LGQVPLFIFKPQLQSNLLFLSSFQWGAHANAGDT